MDNEERILQEIQEIKEDLRGIRRIIKYQVESQTTRTGRLEKQQELLRDQLKIMLGTSVSTKEAETLDARDNQHLEEANIHKGLDLPDNRMDSFIPEQIHTDQIESGEAEDLESNQAEIYNTNEAEGVKAEDSMHEGHKFEGRPTKQHDPDMSREATAYSSIKKASEKHEELEFKIGGIWLNRIAIVLIVFGTAFFLKYAFDNNWVGPIGRIIIGVLFGISFLVAGELFQNKKYTAFAQGVTGGGIAILYFSIFAGYYFFRDQDILSQPLAMVLMIMITAASVILSVRYDSKAIAVLGLIGGFSTPFLLATSQKDYFGLFAYLLILNIGILSIAYYKKWTFLSYLSFSITQLIMLSCYVSYLGSIDEMFWMSEIFFTTVFIIYLLIPVINSVNNNTRISGGEITLIVLNTLFYSLVSFTAISMVYPDFRGFFAILMAIVYGSIGFWARNRNSDKNRIPIIFFGTAIAFITLAIPLQLYKYEFMDLISAGWVIESIILLYAGFRVDSRKMRFTSTIILLLTSAKFLMYDVINLIPSDLALDFYIPLLNKWSLMFAILTSGLFISSYLYKKYSNMVTGDESFLKSLFLVTANAFLFIQISMEISHYFYFLNNGNVSGEILLEYQCLRDGLISITWTLYAVTLTYLGFIRNSGKMRYWGLSILTAALVKLIFVDHIFIFNGVTGYTLLFNIQITSVLFAVAAVFFICYLYKRHVDNVEYMEQQVFNPLMMIGIVVLGAALSTESIRYFNSLGAYRDNTVAIQMQFTLSSIWAIYSIILIFLGIIKKYKPARLFAIGLFGITILKVFLSDLSILTGAYRVLSFIILGFILLTVSFLYQKYKTIITGHLPDDNKLNSYSGDV